MQPLSLDDLMPLEEYAGKRRELFNSHCRYLDHYRRVRVGPSATFVFENRQTLWFRLQEVLLIARLRDPLEVQIELAHFNRLLPNPGQLQAALLVRVPESDQHKLESAPFDGLSEQSIRLRVGKDVLAGHPLTARPEERCLGASHWVVFELDQKMRQRLDDPALPVSLEIALPTYQHQSTPISEEIRQSLLDDLGDSTRESRLAA